MAARLGNGLTSKDKGRHSPLPSYAQEKAALRYAQQPWTTSVYLPLPAVRGRRLRLVLPVPPRIYQASVARFGRKRGSAVFAVGLVVSLWLFLSLARRINEKAHGWGDGIWTDPPTLVFDRPELQRIWRWEIAAGHYPSARLIPEEIGLQETPLNPGLPRRAEHPPQRPLTGLGATRIPTAMQHTVGTGSRRIYLDIASEPPHTAYPPRPVPGSVADLDIIMEHCDFSKDKYVRDCLEVLRIGGGLDNERHVRRGNTDDWKYIFVEKPAEDDDAAALAPRKLDPEALAAAAAKPQALVFQPGLLEAPLQLPHTQPARPYYELEAHCDPDFPRTFHMFWAGPFTDKPYMALLSFLYTQNLGLHLESPPANVCRPQFWLWINPGPAAAVPNPTAFQDMMASLEGNPWSKPFLHPRFRDVIQFKLWNTTEQLDSIPEIKNDWRKYEDALFNSGGHVIKAPKKKNATLTAVPEASVEKKGDTKDQEPSPTNKGSAGATQDDLFERTGTTSASTYDRMSVILSDMARFVLCHRFGGTYLDADTLLMRDWEELWGWKGAFAYRWSRLPKYNTAVLRMSKNSALGSFLFRTALRNGLDFHPMTVSRYTRDAYLEGLLLRLPDALFDSAWLNTEYYQLDRPAFPYLGSFQEFFDTPPQHAAAPQQLGFTGFFRGAYAYHWHNFWWKAFDPARNWPDLGPRFIECEKKQRALLREAQRIEKAKLAQASRSMQNVGKASPAPAPTPAYEEHLEMSDAEDVLSDKRDLGWATVMKRTFEAYIRGEQPNMYGEWIIWP